MIPCPEADERRVAQQAAALDRRQDFEAPRGAPARRRRRSQGSWLPGFMAARAHGACLNEPGNGSAVNRFGRRLGETEQGRQRLPDRRT